MNNQWFNQSTRKVLNQLDTNNNTGLSAMEAQSRLTKHGPNQLQERKSTPMWLLYLMQYKNPLVYILAIGALVSALTGHAVDAIAISVIIVINTFISFWQERKAQNGMKALQEMAAPKALVLRNSQWVSVPAKDLVPGDVVRLQTGDVIPADLRLLEANQLCVDEAALTGESEPVAKSTAVLDSDYVALGDQVNMAFMTTLITTGNGIGVVTATGMNTQVGHIAELMNQTPTTKSPMQIRMDSLAHTLLKVGLTVVAIVCGVGLYYGMPLADILTTGISLSVAAIPEGLPTVVTIVLTMGSTKLAKNNALTKQLDAIETLGSVTVIGSDKTGTLTQNQMQVVKCFDADGHYWDVSGEGYAPKGRFVGENHSQPLRTAKSINMGLTIAAICSEATLVSRKGKWTIQGSPTEGAVTVAAAKAGYSKDALLEEGRFRVVRSYPFDSTRKLASVIVQDTAGDYFLAVKGAPDVILGRSTNYYGTQQHDSNDVQRNLNRFEQAIDSFANQALRTLAVAYRPLTSEQIDLDLDQLEQQLAVVALFGIIDPPRPEVKASIMQCHQAGIRTVMITGDHAQTAAAIAKQIGIMTGEAQGVLTGAELDEMSDEMLQQLSPYTSVYARVTPEHKLRIVNALQETQEVTAMTGDGVNDAPALRRADIGVAMGITGTSVAKDSGDMILLDDNFSTIVTAVRQGRQIFDNLRKFMRQALTANVAEVSVILFAFLAMGSDAILPLTPLMILWVNLVSDGLPALALGMEPEEPDVMKRKPRKRNESFFSQGLGARILSRGLVIGAVSYAMFSWGLDQGFSSAYAQTLAFITLIFAQLWHLFDSRTLTTLYRKNPFSNRYLLMAITASATLSLLVIYTSWGSLVFGTEALSLTHLFAAIWVSGSITFILSALKELTDTKLL